MSRSAAALTLHARHYDDDECEKSCVCCDKKNSYLWTMRLSRMRKCFFQANISDRWATNLYFNVDKPCSAHSSHVNDELSLILSLFALFSTRFQAGNLIFFLSQKFNFEWSKRSLKNVLEAFQLSTMTCHKHSTSALFLTFQSFFIFFSSIIFDIHSKPLRHSILKNPSMIHHKDDYAKFIHDNINPLPTTR